VLYRHHDAANAIDATSHPQQLGVLGGSGSSLEQFATSDNSR